MCAGVVPCCCREAKRVGVGFDRSGKTEGPQVTWSLDLESRRQNRTPHLLLLEELEALAFRGTTLQVSE